jgi:hypothetical protein
MTPEQKTAAEQITILTQLIADASAGYLIQPPELHQDEIVALRAVLATLQQHERAMAALRELTEAVDAIPDHNIVSHTTFVIGVSSAQAIALGIKAMAALDDAASAAATPAGKG